MNYTYLGKEIEVVRMTEGGVAQLADGSWVPSSMLVETTQKNIKAATLAAKRMEKSEGG